MSSKNSKHIHRYYKAYSKDGRAFLWTCPNCQHHMPKHYEHTLVGRVSECWGHSRDCRENVILDERALAMDKPLCESCDPKSIDASEPDAADILKELGLLGKLD